MSRSDAGSAAPPPSVVLLDIEGTVAPLRFVHAVLFPFARARLADFVATAAAIPERAAALDRVRALGAPGATPLDTLRDWTDADRKIEPLKTIQGMIWADGYRDGMLRGQLYGDVAPFLRAWRAAGIRLAVYSSGSEAAQRLIFGHSEAGDLVPLFGGFFDTRVGAKREADSYRRIAVALDAAPDAILFLSDVVAELDAARDAGLDTCQLVRAGDGTVAGADHPVAADLAAVAARRALPGPGRPC